MSFIDCLAHFVYLNNICKKLGENKGNEVRIKVRGKNKCNLLIVFKIPMHWVYLRAHCDQCSQMQSMQS